MTDHVITLADGRRLRWHEFGDPEGAPVLYTAGTPVSGLGGATYDKAARAAGLTRELPDATLHVGDSSGHDVGSDHSGEIMSVLASHVK